MGIAAALLLATAGWAGLALAMEKHRRDVWREAPPPLVLRLAGTAALAAALAACVAGSGGAIGIVAWLGVLTAAGFAVVLALACVPRLRRR